MNNPRIELSNNGNVASSDKMPIAQTRQQRTIILVSLVATLLALGALLGGGYYFLLASTNTAKWRDLFIIGLTIELFLLGTGTIILTYQVALLINLIKTEVQPVLESANETINTLRGTATFLSDNLVRPVMKVNGYIAALRRVLSFINFGK